MFFSRMDKQNQVFPCKGITVSTSFACTTFNYVPDDVCLCYFNYFVVIKTEKNEIQASYVAWKYGLPT